ncbi:hypothetical protein M501DRAFT_927999, partial [Patellaria atrata CBS 101060]
QGLPNFRLRLPSRNWMIFLSITGSWTAAVIYDRREKKRIQKKWATVVSHLAEEAVPTSVMPRKLTIFLTAPPADGLMAARDHFHEYVKPILVSASLDWDAIEGRREGDVRAALAERIRQLRKLKGEHSTEPVEEEDADVITYRQRQRSGIREWDGIQGDIIIGRNTWKEYVRGLHEGWLGPLDPPPPPPEADPLPSSTPPESSTPLSSTTIPGSQPSELVPDTPHTTSDDASPTTTPPPESPSETPPAEQEKKPTKRKQPDPFISPSQYSTATLAPTCPPELPPSTTISFPHILGFLNTPTRMYRFLNRRKVADDIGRQTAAAVLASYRPFAESGHGDGAFLGDDATSSGDENQANSQRRWEQQTLLIEEEAEWHKSVRKTKEGDQKKERVWLDEVVLDPRIAGRMRRFEVTPEEEQRADRIRNGEGALGSTDEERDR